MSQFFQKEQKKTVGGNTPPNYFIHYGCWGEPCHRKTGEQKVGEPKPNPEIEVKTEYEQIIQQIMQDSHKPSFISIAGDNYYPEKIKGGPVGNSTKRVLIEELKKAFESLAKYEDVPVNIIYGNHDIPIDAHEFYKGIECKYDEGTQKENKETVKNTCYLKILENAEVDKLKKSNNNININIGFQHFIKDKIKDTCVCMIDTTMYMDSEFNKDCYTEDINPSREKQLSSTLAAIGKKDAKENNSKNVVIVGHHPFISFKKKIKKEENKKKEVMDETDISPSFFEFFKRIYDEYGESKKYYYLCADVHLYQKGTIELKILLNDGTTETMKIEQHVVGTGGTELDKVYTHGDAIKGKRTTGDLFQIELKKYLIKTVFNMTSTPDVTYTVREPEDQIENHGYLKVTEPTSGNDSLQFEFIPLVGAQGGGKRRKSKKKQRKKSKRRKTGKRKKNERKN